MKVLPKIMNRLHKRKNKGVKLVATIKGNDNKNKWLPVTSDKQEIVVSIKLSNR